MESQISDVDHCRSCGWRGPGRCLCVAVFGSPSEHAQLIEAARAGNRESARLVGHIRDESSRVLLETVVLAGDDVAVVDAAVSGLANIAAEASWPALAPLLPEAWGARLGHLIRYLGRVATPESVEVLAALVDRCPPAAVALATLGDERGIDSLLAALRPGHRHFSDSVLPSIERLPDGPWTARLVDVLVQVAHLDTATEAAVLARLRAQVGDQAAELPTSVEGWIVAADDPQREAQLVESLRGRQREVVSRHLIHLAMLVRRRCGDAGAAAIDVASARSGLDLSMYAPDRSTGPVGQEPGPSELAWALDYELGDAQHPGTRFGGQPTWLEAPTWPLTSVGTPMAFWAQFRLPDDKAMAYLFVDHHDGIIATTHGTASVFIQPGGRPVGDWSGTATGPSLPDSSHRDRSYGPPWPWSRAARIPSLDPFTEPGSWDLSPGGVPDRSWDKVGGTPVYLQGTPDFAGYEHLCQFTAERAGHELGDAAQAYVFIDRASGAGLFHWDCH